MQTLDNSILFGLKKVAQKKFGIKEFESEFKDFKLLSHGDKISCPICHYESKKNRTTAKIFKNKEGTSFKCFSCGAWRLIK